MRIELERLSTNDKPKHSVTATLLYEIITVVSPNTGVQWRCWPNTQPCKQPKLRFLIFFGEPHGASLPRLVRFQFFSAYARETQLRSSIGSEITIGDEARRIAVPRANRANAAKLQHARFCRRHRFAYHRNAASTRSAMKALTHADSAITCVISVITSAPTA